MMELKAYASASEFRDRVFPFLRRNEASNGLVLGIVDTLINKPTTYPTALLWSAQDRDQIVGAAWMTPPHPLGLTEMPDESLELVLVAAAKLTERVSGVVGPKAQSDLFRARWSASHGIKSKSTMEQRIYQLTKVSMPFSVPGTMRLADAQDLPLLEEWNIKYIHDCRLDDSAESAKKAAVRAIENKARYLWIDEGKAVSMAARAGGSTPSGVGINWVYTPNNLRGRGYASAIVASLSQKMLSEGRKFCFLYTDLSNPTSNSIYQKIGYQVVCDSAHHIFEDG